MSPNPQRSASTLGSWCHSPTPSVFLYCVIIHYSLFSQIMLKLTYSNWFTCHPLNIPCTFLPATFYSHCSSHLENPLLSNQVHPSFICSSHPNSSVSFLIHPRLGWALLYFVAFVVAGVMDGWSADVFCLASQCLERKKKKTKGIWMCLDGANTLQFARSLHSRCSYTQFSDLHQGFGACKPCMYS